MGVISLRRDGDIVCSAWKHAAVLLDSQDGYGLANHTEHKDFSTVVSTKKVPLKELANYGSDLLNITETDEMLGYKHVFQTLLTQKTTGERIRSPMGMFTQAQTYMDNDAQILLDHLHEYYN
jgi:hypothetical protein